MIYISKKRLQKEIDNRLKVIIEEIVEKVKKETTIDMESIKRKETDIFRNTFGGVMTEWSDKIYRVVGNALSTIKNADMTDKVDLDKLTKRVAENLNKFQIKC